MMTRAALLRKNLTNYSLNNSKIISGPFTTRSKSLAPFKTEIKIPETNESSVENSPLMSRKNSVDLLQKKWIGNNDSQILPRNCGFDLNRGMLRYKGIDLINELLNEDHPY